MDLDPTVFGTVAAVDVFSSTGDQVGSATIEDRHIDTKFASSSGGIGQLPGLPVMVVTVPILATAPSGATASLTFSAGSQPWKDVQGNQYLPASQPAQIKVGGTLSIGSVTPGGGMLPAGTKVRVAGTGLTADTAVQIDGVALASTAFVGPQAIDFVLFGAADLTGKRVVVRNPDGTQADFFSALRGPYYSQVANIQPIFPQQTYTGADLGDTASGYAIQNPNLEPVVVQLSFVAEQKYASTGSAEMTLPPGAISMTQYRGPQSGVTAASGTPIRMLADLLLGALPEANPLPSAQTSATWDQEWACVSYGGPTFGGTDSACYPWLIGSPLPALTAGVSSPGPFTVSAASTGGGNWLSVSAAESAPCSPSPSGYPCIDTAILTVHVDPSSLTAGEYNGTITITPTTERGTPAALYLTFRVTTSLISVPSKPPVFGNIMQFVTDAAHTPPAPITLQVTSSGTSAPFSVTAGAPWVSVTPASGATPATLTVTADPSAASTVGSGPLPKIVISGPANSVVFFASLIEAAPKALSASPSSLTFWAKAGSAPSAAQSAAVTCPPDSITIATDDGHHWLLATGTFQGLSVSVDPSALGAGTYHGTITAAAASGCPGYAPVQVAVTLAVWAEPPVLMATPASLEVTAASGSGTQYFQVAPASGGLPVDFTVATSTEDGNSWLTAYGYATYVNPAGYAASLEITAANLPPATYHGEAVLTGPAGSPNSVTVPVTLNVTNEIPPLPQPGPPLGVSIVNAASLARGAISPGEVVTILGLNIGPSPAVDLLGGNGNAATDLSGTAVLFDDLPAQLLYASPTQVNAVVPFEIGHRKAVNVVMEFNGLSAVAAGMPTAPAAPAIFTADGSGQGQARATNQDGSANSAGNPAGRGSIIAVFATGLGETAQTRVARGITTGKGEKPALPISVSVGDADAMVRDVGPAPGLAEGVSLIHVLVPPGAAPGPAVPIVLLVGPMQSPNGVTIAVQ